MWRKVAYTVKVHTDVLLYSAYHNPVNAVKAVAMFGREIPLRKNNGIWFTALPGSKGDPALFRKGGVRWLAGKALSQRKSNGILGKLWLQKRDSSSVSRPFGGTKLYLGIVLWIPVTTIWKIPLFLRGGDARCKKMSGDTTGILQNREKASAEWAEASGKKIRCFCESKAVGEQRLSFYRLRTAKPKTVPHTPPTICIKLATWSCTKSMP